MSVLSALKAYLNECPFLDEMARSNIHIDLNEENPTEYCLCQTGDVLIQRYIDGKEKRQSSFGLDIRNYTFDDAKRLENSGFCERLIFWLSDNSKYGILPELDSGVTPLSISAENGMLFDISESGDIGTYRIQIKLIYRR